MNVEDHVMFLLPPPARRQEVGPQRPDVPLPAPEAADALHGEVGAPSLCAPP